MLLRTFFAFRGPPAVFAKLCEEATKAAFGRPGAGRSDKLTVADFADGFDFFLKHDRRMLGVNPFRAKKLPNIPLSIDGPMTFETEKRTGSGQVRTLVDG